MSGINFDLKIQGTSIIYDQKINSDRSGKFTRYHNPQDLKGTWENMLNTALREVVKNAAEGRETKFFSTVSKVSMTVRIDDKTDQLIIEVIDNGEGMPPGNFKNMLTTKGHPEERGLGLKVIYDIIEDRLGGKVEIESHPVEKVGRASSGTTVRFLIPAHTAKMNLKNEKELPHGDLAQIAKKGGIDLTPANMNIEIKKEIASSPLAPRNDTNRSPNEAIGPFDVSEGIKFHMNAAMLAQLQNAPGFVPVIINIQPLTNLRGFLGIQETVGNSQGVG